MARPKRAVVKSRLTVDLNPSARARLESLQVLTEADSMSEVIRRALAVYEMVMENEKTGGITHITAPDGVPRQVLLDW